MTKARTLADFISDGSTFADGAISVAEVSGAAPTASPTFTGDATFDTDTLFVDSANSLIGVGTTAPSHPSGTGITVFDTSVPRIALKNSTTGNTSTDGFEIAMSGNQVFLQNREDSDVFLTQNATTRLSIKSAEAVFNDNGSDYDFRVESDTNANMIFMDASSNVVAFGVTTSPYDHASNEGFYYNYGGSLDIASNTNTLRINRNGTGGNDRPNIELQNNGDTQGYIGTRGAGDGLYFGANASDSTQKDFEIRNGGTITNGFSSMRYRYPQGAGAHTGNENGNYWKLGTLSNFHGSESCEIILYGTQSYSANADIAGKTTLILRGSNSSTTTEAAFWSETMGGQGIQAAAWVKTANDTYDIYVKLSSFYGLEFTVTTSGVWTTSISSTSSTSVPTNGVNFEPRYYFMLGSADYATVMTTGATVFNDSSLDKDFRVESNTNANAIYLDAGGDRLHFGNTSTAQNNTESNYISVTPGSMHVFFAGNSRTVAYFNRNGSDGSIVDFRNDNSVQGSISVSGSTVSYNGFSGRHESSGIPANTPIGTVVSTIDELDVYPDTTHDTDLNVIPHPRAGQTRADHAKVEVSNLEGDPCVYGVVSEFDDDGKLIVTSVGIGSIRVTGACAKGDLLESNGDGTARAQSDDIIRSKTIGKVTIGNSNTGVKLVSCVMYCG